VAGVALAALGWLWWRAWARTWAPAWARLVAQGAAPLCMAGVALGDMAGVALGDIHLGFAWQAWHLDHLVTSAFVLRGRCGTW